MLVAGHGRATEDGRGVDGDKVLHSGGKHMAQRDYERQGTVGGSTWHSETTRDGDRVGLVDTSSVEEGAE
jgi:hypothetical protein